MEKFILPSSVQFFRFRPLGTCLFYLTILLFAAPRHYCCSHPCSFSRYVVLADSSMTNFIASIPTWWSCCDFELFIYEPTVLHNVHAVYLYLVCPLAASDVIEPFASHPQSSAEP